MPRVDPDDQRFAAWYEAERDGMVRALTMITHDVDTAREVTAEAFTRAYERWSRVSRMNSPTGWVYRVAVNDVRRRARRRDLERRLLRREPAPRVADTTTDPALWEAVAALPDRQREVIVLRYVADLREREVAEVLGISEGAASAALTAARKALAHQLAEPEEAQTKETRP
jgi:RNA polymerase sigma-70 factor (ECF subfamily)